MRHPAVPFFLLSIIRPPSVFLAFLAGLASCAGDSNTVAVSESQATDAAELPENASGSIRLPAGPSTDLPPNELGEIMVLEYHRLGEPEGEFYRSAENFKSDLHRLYDAGYRPITVRQMIEGKIDLPRGTSPVVFTIDDSSTGQFYLLEDGSIDPTTMVGMWAEFSAANPEWENGATWCVLAGADYPSNFFGEKVSREVARAEREERIRRKIDYLVSNGHEICNHTLFHARLDRAPDDATAQEWIGRGEDSIRVYLPENYDIVTLGLPLGIWPANRALAYSGEYNGRPYEYKGVLNVIGGPSPSPFDVEFDPLSINRIIVTPGALTRNLTAYERQPERRFVSDGAVSTITVPPNLADQVARARWPDVEVVVAGPVE
jgi:hypothetical protein